MSFFKTIPNKTLFYGGWFLNALGSLAMITILIDQKDFGKIPEPMLNWLIVVIFGCIIVIYLMGNEFIKKSLTVKPKNGDVA